MSADWIDASKRLPPERKTVLVWLADKALPFCGYIRIHSNGPFWVVYHGNMEISTDVLYWSACLPSKAPDAFSNQHSVYERGQLGTGKRSRPPTEQERNRKPAPDRLAEPAQQASQEGRA